MTGCEGLASPGSAFAASAIFVLASEDRLLERSYVPAGSAPACRNALVTMASADVRSVAICWTRTSCAASARAWSRASPRARKAFPPSEGEDEADEDADDGRPFAAGPASPRRRGADVCAPVAGSGRGDRGARAGRHDDGGGRRRRTAARHGAGLAHLPLSSNRLLIGRFVVEVLGEQLTSCSTDGSATSRRRHAWRPIAASRTFRANRPFPKPSPRGVAARISRNRSRKAGAGA